MGSKYTVLVWGKHHGDDNGYSNTMAWQGPHLLPALWALWQAKRKGWGCVTLEVRG